MTKIRKPLSIEKILKDSINKLNEKEIETLTGKSISHFRKCSDPDDKDHNLHLSDAIKIDILSLKSQNFTPRHITILYAFRHSFSFVINLSIFLIQSAKK